MQRAEEQRRGRGGEGGRGCQNVEEDEDEGTEDQREIEAMLMQEMFVFGRGKQGGQLARTVGPV